MKSSILVYGIGNPGRQDDALGNLLVEEIDKWIDEQGIQTIQTDQNYQLNIEDAEVISNFDLVIFVDASVVDITSTLLEEVIPDLKTDFSMHSVTPSFVVGLCQEIYNRIPNCYQFHIKGYEFNFMEPLTKKAKHNLKTAFSELRAFIMKQLD